MEGYQWGGGGERMGGKVQEIRSRTCSYKIEGEGKNNIGNGEATELVCMTHGHELRVRGNAGGRGGAWQRGRKGREKWDYSNSIIKKIHLKIKNKINYIVLQFYIYLKICNSLQIC